MSRRNRIKLSATGVPQIDAASYPEFTTMAEFVRRILPEIDDLAERGYELAEICQIVSEKSGVDLAVPTFKSTVSRLRRETRTRVPQRVQDRLPRHAPASSVPVAATAVATAVAATGVSEAFRSRVRQESPQHSASNQQSSRGFVDRDDL